VADAGALDHDVVLLHLAVMGEPAHRVDGLVSQVVPGNILLLLLEALTHRICI
jgi:hypothetical protein